MIVTEGCLRCGAKDHFWRQRPHPYKKGLLFTSKKAAPAVRGKGMNYSRPQNTLISTFGQMPTSESNACDLVPEMKLPKLQRSTMTRIVLNFRNRFFRRFRCSRNLYAALWGRKKKLYTRRIWPASSSLTLAQRHPFVRST